MDKKLNRLLDAVQLVISHEDFDMATIEFGELLDEMAEAFNEIKNNER